METRLLRAWEYLFGPQIVGSLIIEMAIVAHLVDAVALVMSRGAYSVGISGLIRALPLPISVAPWALIPILLGAVASSMIAIRSTKLRPGFISLLLVPQQLILIITALSSISSIWRGAIDSIGMGYITGVGSWYIVTDQVWRILIAPFFTAAILLRARYDGQRSR